MASLDLNDRILATYLVETPHPLAAAAVVLAGEQSTGTFVAVPRETEALNQRFAARIESIEVLETVDTPTLPHSRPPRGHQGPVRYQRGRVKVSFALENVGPSLPNVITMMMG